MTNQTAAFALDSTAAVGTEFLGQVDFFGQVLTVAEMLMENLGNSIGNRGNQAAVAENRRSSADTLQLFGNLRNGNVRTKRQ